MPAIGRWDLIRRLKVKFVTGGQTLGNKNAHFLRGGGAFNKKKIRVICMYSVTEHFSFILNLPSTTVIFLNGLQQNKILLISNFRHVLNVVYFLLGYSPASEFYMPTFRNTVQSS